MDNAAISIRGAFHHHLISATKNRNLSVIFDTTFNKAVLSITFGCNFWLSIFSITFSKHYYQNHFLGRKHLTPKLVSTNFLNLLKLKFSGEIANTISSLLFLSLFGSNLPAADLVTLRHIFLIQFSELKLSLKNAIFSLKTNTFLAEIFTFCLQFSGIISLTNFANFRLKLTQSRNKATYKHHFNRITQYRLKLKKLVSTTIFIKLCCNSWAEKITQTNFRFWLKFSRLIKKLDLVNAHYKIQYPAANPITSKQFELSKPQQYKEGVRLW